MDIIKGGALCDDDDSLWKKYDVWLCECWLEFDED